MNTDLVTRFATRWPSWFAGLQQGPEESCLAFGFECGDGWFQLLWELCCDIETLGAPPEFTVHQVKEKYGSLRFYTGGCDDDIYDRICLAERYSEHVCEQCGEPGTIGGKGWISTLCDKCRRK